MEKETNKGNEKQGTHVMGCLNDLYGAYISTVQQHSDGGGSVPVVATNRKIRIGKFGSEGIVCQAAERKERKGRFRIP